MFKIGDKIRIIDMKGEDHYNGREGVIEYIDGLDQLNGTWGDFAIIAEENLIELINNDMQLVQIKKSWLTLTIPIQLEMKSAVQNATFQV